MNDDFVKLVKDEYEKIQNGESCFYIGEGNPDADILIIGNECAIDDNDQCSEDERRKNKERIVAEDNVKKWKELLDRGYDVGDIGRELNDYKGVPDNSKYYPLFPWFGQRCIVRTEVKKGDNKKKKPRGENGTALTWVRYQKLIDWIYGEEFDRNNFIDFHLNAFHTELSQIPRKSSDRKYNKETDDSIQKRMKELFGNPFFRRFPVVIIAAGHYVKKYKIDNSTNRLTIEKVFDVEYNKDDKGKSGWINLHKSSNSRRLLLHTKHFAERAKNDDYIKEIAARAKKSI